MKIESGKPNKYVGASFSEYDLSKVAGKTRRRPRNYSGELPSKTTTLPYFSGPALVALKFFGCDNSTIRRLERIAREETY